MPTSKIERRGLISVAAPTFILDNRSVTTSIEPNTYTPDTYSQVSENCSIHLVLNSSPISASLPQLKWWADLDSCT